MCARLVSDNVLANEVVFHNINCKSICNGWLDFFKFFIFLFTSDLCQWS